MRVADRDDELSDAQALRVTELGGDEIPAVDAQHREVGERIGADHLELELAAVDERRATAALGARDHVRRGEREAVRGDHDAAATAVEDAAAANPSRHPEVRDRRRKPFRNGRDCARIRVESLVVAAVREWRRDERELHHGQASNGPDGWVDLRKSGDGRGGDEPRRRGA